MHLRPVCGEERWGEEIDTQQHMHTSMYGSRTCAMVARVSAIMEENTTLRTRPCTTCASFSVTWEHDGINSDEGDL